MSIKKIMRQLPPLQNVVANGTATGQVTPGRTIERIILRLGGTTFTKAMLTLIKLKANGKTFFEATGTQLDKLMTYRGMAASANYLSIDFTEIRGRDVLDQMIGAFDTSVGISNITIEATITGATAPTLDAFVVESGKQTGPYAPLLQKVLRYPWQSTVGGKVNLTLPFGAQVGAVIKRVHFEQVTGNITALEVKQDGLTLHESALALNQYVQGEHQRVPQNLWYTADFIVDMNQGNALDTRDAKSLEFNITLSAADSGFVIVEYYDVLGNL
ncbi:MAG: hypothetical protein RugAbin2_02414 [Rugosibacter sp.]|nr:hypothetical protein [Rugosibacter sp.]